MNLYIVERTDSTSWGECSSILCTAETNYKAKKVKRLRDWSCVFSVGIDQLKARKIGISAIYDTPKILMENWNSE